MNIYLYVERSIFDSDYKVEKERRRRAGWRYIISCLIINGHGPIITIGGRSGYAKRNRRELVSGQWRVRVRSRSKNNAIPPSLSLLLSPRVSIRSRLSRNFWYARQRHNIAPFFSHVPFFYVPRCNCRQLPPRLLRFFPFLIHPPSFLEKFLPSFRRSKTVSRSFINFHQFSHRDNEYI